MAEGDGTIYEIKTTQDVGAARMNAVVKWSFDDNPDFYFFSELNDVEPGDMEEHLAALETSDSVSFN